MRPSLSRASSAAGDSPCAANHAPPRDQERAIADFSQSIRIDARNALAFYNRGLSYWDRRDFDKALADYEQAIRLNPGYAPTYYNRGLAYYNKKDYNKAISDYSEAIRLMPDYADAYSAFTASGAASRPHHGIIRRSA